MSRRHVLDRDVRRRRRGRLLVGGAPARMLRLSDAGAAALERLLAGEGAPEAEALRDRLREHGMLHPLAAPARTEVTFVLPVRDGGAALAELVGRLRAWGEVIVVDDGSRDDGVRGAAAAGARTIVNRGRPGPAAARNAGLAAAATEFVAFLDADCVCPRDWARPLAALLAEDDGLALAAPRVHSLADRGALARYERLRSPLDLGPHPGLVGPGRRIGFVPSAALVGRRAALLELGGFDEGMRFGEDVDLVWRAVDAGFRVRYAPEVEVEHRPRASLAGFARQRFDYAGSAAALERRHPGAAAPLRLDRNAALTWVLAPLLLGWRGACGAGAGLLGAGALRWRRRGAGLPVAALAARGLLASGRQLARAASRDWLPATVLACLLSRRARRAAALALAVDAAAGAAAAPQLLAPRNLLLRAVENAAYAAGLWRGAVLARSPRALLPSWRSSGAGR